MFNPVRRAGMIPESFKEDCFAALLEFVGTTVFLLLGLGSIQAVTAEAAATASSSSNIERVLYISSGMGFSLLVSAWLFYRVTGSLFNPNVSLALLIVGVITPVRFVLYCIAQLLGAIAASSLVIALTPGPLSVNAMLQPGINAAQGVFIEMFITAALVLAVLMLAAEKHNTTPFAPIGVGLTLFACHLFAVNYTGAAMNTARAFGPAAVTGFPNGDHWVYWLGPFLGSILAQIQDWKVPIMPRADTHKTLCPANKIYMQCIPELQAVLNQFTWGRIESDGTFAQDLVKARLGVLGSGPSFGYWSVPGGQQAHDIPRSQQAKGTWVPRSKDYIHGEIMLGQEWPTDIEAWKLKDPKLVPRLFFEDEFPPLQKPLPGQVKDWKSWYEWRGLSTESPVALMMDFPLSVYYLILDVLKVVRVDSSSAKQQKLNLHYLGAEVELNYLPLFSELALLLPNTQITLTFFGKAAYDLVHTARKSYPSSLATQDIVWSYQAPKKTGGGSIDIKLYSEQAHWSRGVLLKGNSSPPDAMVACDAGLFAYPEWSDPMLFAAAFGIPFGITEYSEQSMKTCTKNLPIMFMGAARDMPDPKYASNIREQMERDHPITFNPFHRPGQRSLPNIRMPNAFNGFALPVVMKDRTVS